MKSFDVPLGTSDIDLYFACDPLKIVTLVGRIQQSDLVGKFETISVAYDSLAPCFFLLARNPSAFDCPVAPMQDIATTKVDAEGTFTVELPNFTTNPVLSGADGFEFSIRKGYLEPESKDFQSPTHSMKIASSYPKDLIFIPRKIQIGSITQLR
jgi:hypothetical protein